MKKKSKLITQNQKIWEWFLTPPYYGVPWLVWLYAFVSLFIYLHATGPLTGHLIGFDDHVRMYQVLELVNGKGWYDRTIMRVNLPEGFHTIWPRIVDIPIALVIIIAQQFTDQKTAALIASVVVPYAELAILFYVAAYFARPLVGKNNARLMALFLMFTSVLNQKKYTIAGFHPGQASHHSWYIILNLLMFGAATRVALGVRGNNPVIATGAAIAVLLAVGIEGFPMVAGLATVFAAVALYFESPYIAHRGAAAIGYGALFSLCLVPLNQPPARLFEVSFAEPSILAPILVGAAALFLYTEYFLLKSFRKKQWQCGALLAVLAVVMGSALVLAFPQILDGAGAALSPAERDMANHHHPEAWPLWRVAASPVEFIGLIAPILIALGAGIYAVKNTKTRKRRILYAMSLGFTFVACAMTQIFWRYYHHAMTTSCAWLLWSWLKIKQTLRKNVYYSLAALGVFIALGPFWMLLLPAITTDAPIVTQVMFFPAKVLGPWDACDIRGIAPYINDHYGKDTTLIVPGDDSAKFLYHTNVIIDFLANFPSQNKFIDNTVFFQTQNPAVAQNIARRHNIDLVALCPALPLAPEDLKTRPYREPLFMELLAERNPPSWLKMVTIGGNYILYEVDHKILNQRDKDE